MFVMCLLVLLFICINVLTLMCLFVCIVLLLSLFVRLRNACIAVFMLHACLLYDASWYVDIMIVYWIYCVVSVVLLVF